MGARPRDGFGFLITILCPAWHPEQSGPAGWARTCVRMGLCAEICQEQRWQRCPSARWIFPRAWLWDRPMLGWRVRAERTGELVLACHDGRGVAAHPQALLVQPVHQRGQNPVTSHPVHCWPKPPCSAPRVQQFFLQVIFCAGMAEHTPYFPGTAERNSGQTWFLCAVTAALWQYRCFQAGSRLKA